MIRQWIWAVGLLLGCLMGTGTARAQSNTVVVNPITQKSVQLRVGDILAVQLMPNANPAPVGNYPHYEWQVVENNPALLQPVKLMADSRSLPLMRFRALSVGHGQLTIVDQDTRRKSTKPITTLRLQVTVVPVGTVAHVGRGGGGGGLKILLSDRDNGRTFTANPRNTLVVQLTATPANGYQWFGELSAPGILEQIGKSEYHAPVHTQIPGPGLQVFRYRVVGSGRVAIRMLYRRPGANTTPSKKWEVRVSVPRQPIDID